MTSVFVLSHLRAKSPYTTGDFDPVPSWKLEETTIGLGQGVYKKKKKLKTLPIPRGHGSINSSAKSSPSG